MRAPWSLQRRLVVALVALIAIVSVIVGTTSVLALRQNLLQRLDQQVSAELRFVERANGPFGGAGTPVPGNGDPDDGAGARSSVRLVMLGGTAEVSQYVDDNRTSTDLTTTQPKQLISLHPKSP